jgi:hypothetical protein
MLKGVLDIAHEAARASLPSMARKLRVEYPGALYHRLRREKLSARQAL